MLKHEFSRVVDQYVIPQGAPVPADGLPHIGSARRARLLLRGIASPLGPPDTQRQVALFDITRADDRRYHVLCAGTAANSSLLNLSFDVSEIRREDTGAWTLDVYPEGPLVFGGDTLPRLGTAYINPVDLTTGEPLNGLSYAERLEYFARLVGRVPTAQAVS